MKPRTFYVRPVGKRHHLVQCWPVYPAVPSTLPRAAQPADTAPDRAREGLDFTDPLTVATLLPPM